MKVTVGFKADLAASHRRIRRDMTNIQELTGEARAEVVRCLLKAGTRISLRRNAQLAPRELLLAGLLLIGSLTIQVIISPKPGSASSTLGWAAVGAAALASAVLIARGFGKLAAMHDGRWPQLFAHFVGRAYAFFVALAVTVIFLLAERHPEADRPVTGTELVQLVVLDAGIGSFCVWAVWEWFRNRKVRRRHPRQDLDSLMLVLHAIAARIGQARRTGLWNAGHARSIASDLEALAWTAEYYPPFGGRVPVADYQARAIVRREGARLAALIRLHKEPVLTALHPEQLERVEASICQGLLHWKDGDWSALTEHAPAVVISRRWYRLWQRLWPAVVLAGFGVVLPLIHQFAGGSASSLRISLFVAAALSLVAGGVPVAEKVQDAVGKSLPWSKAG
ncbi:hypothetical protein P3T36_004659 [Kitasatospora sp. MAP12-15]|uniref:hypothetical protein n=1 Tax=unclassified Kitasatospora TaxID=2633591 RepID=UPI0024752B76|nr:hypothetical protein [Kitasatospora sp. MAP12-44]MDH6111505.1 hypothetical protein [Kitasatospora sp. MAP12-44]